MAQRKDGTRLVPSLGKSPSSGLLNRQLPAAANPTELVGNRVLCCLQVVPLLQSSPELDGHVEVLGQEPSRFGADRPLAETDFIDTPDRHTDVCGQLGLTDAHGLQEVFQQNLAGMHRRQIAGPAATLIEVVADGLGRDRHGFPLSVVVHDFDVPGIPVPPLEADAPLVVDADGVLASPVASEGLKPVAGRHPQMIQRRGAGKLGERTTSPGNFEEACLPLNDLIMCLF